MNKLSNLVKKEIKVVMNLEHQELREFGLLVEETLQEIEKTKKEMSIEERLQINLNFLHYSVTPP